MSCRYLELGMELKAVNRVMAFTQERVAGDFIKKTTKKRGEALTKVQKNLYKFINVRSW